MSTTVIHSTGGFHSAVLADRAGGGSVVESAASATRLRLTTRGRRALAALIALPLALGIGAAALAGGSALASGEITAPVAFDTVTVLPGDTLWAIAAEIAPAADPRDVVAEISRLNNIHGGIIVAGHELAIPAKYSN